MRELVSETRIRHPRDSKSMAFTFGFTFAVVSLGMSAAYLMYLDGETVWVTLIAAYLVANLVLYFSQLFTPHLLGADALSVRMGLLFRVTVPYRNIARISNQYRPAPKVLYPPGGIGEKGKQTVWAFTSRHNLVRLELCEPQRTWLFYLLPIPIRFIDLIINVEDIDDFAREYQRHAPAHRRT